MVLFNYFFADKDRKAHDAEIIIGIWSFYVRMILTIRKVSR